MNSTDLAELLLTTVTFSVRLWVILYSCMTPLAVAGSCHSTVSDVALTSEVLTFLGAVGAAVTRRSGIYTKSYLQLKQYNYSMPL